MSSKQWLYYIRTRRGHYSLFLNICNARRCFWSRFQYTVLKFQAHSRVTALIRALIHSVGIKLGEWLTDNYKTAFFLTCLETKVISNMIYVLSCAVYAICLKTYMWTCFAYQDHMCLDILLPLQWLSGLSVNCKFLCHDTFVYTVHTFCQIKYYYYIYYTKVT